MKAISLWQPWATLLVTGHKEHETRGWPTQVRGTVAVHAAKKKCSEARELVLEYPFCDALNDHELSALPFGCLIGTVDLVACVQAEKVYAPGIWGHEDPDFFFGNFEPGRWAWKCESPRMLAEPIPYRGMQGFFELPPDVARILARLER